MGTFHEALGIAPLYAFGQKCWYESFRGLRFRYPDRQHGTATRRNPLVSV
jgi:hypothetical protein